MLANLAKHNWKSWSGNIGLLSIFLVLVSTLIIPEKLGVSRLENLTLPLLLMGVIGINTIRTDRTILTLVLILFITTVFSNLVNMKGTEAYINSIRFIKYGLLFVITGQLIQWHKKTFERLFDVFVIFLMVINIVQVFNFFGWGIDLLNTYSTQELAAQYNQTLNEGFRLYGTQNNPNDNALIWGMICMYYFARQLDRKNYWNLFVISTSVIFLFLTQSRTALIGFVSAFGIYYLFQNFSVKKLLVLTATGGLGLILLQLSGLTYLQQIIYNNPLEISSLTKRYDVWGQMIELWKDHPIFGLGLETNYTNLTGKAPDSEYIFFLVSCGALFIVPYVSLIFYCIYKGFKQLNGKDLSSPFYSLYVLLPIYLIFCGITNFTFNNVKVAALLFILLATVNSLKAKPDHEKDTAAI